MAREITKELGKSIYRDERTERVLNLDVFVELLDRVVCFREPNWRCDAMQHCEPSSEPLLCEAPFEISKAMAMPPLDGTAGLLGAVGRVPFSWALRVRAFVETLRWALARVEVT